MSDPVDTAVIEILLDRLGSVYSKHSEPGASEESLKAHEAKIAKVREWASTLGWFERRRYYKWLDVWQRGVDDYREEQRTGAEKKKWQRVSDRIEAEREEASRIKETMPAPPRF